MQFKSFRHNQGFTLVELITVIVILGILATVGASKFFKQSSFSDTRYHQEILSAFRYAQKIAIASQCPVTISLTSNSYALSYSSPCSGDVKHPAGQSSYNDTITSTISPAANYTYNASGEAFSTGSFTVGGHNITIEAVTGYVHE